MFMKNILSKLYGNKKLLDLTIMGLVASGGYLLFKRGQIESIEQLIHMVKSKENCGVTYYSGGKPINMAIQLIDEIES